MADGKVVIDSEIDDKGIQRGIKNIKDSLRSLDSQLAQTSKLGSAITIAPTLSPMVASLTAGVGGLSSAFMAAGVGVAGFGAVAVATLNDVFEANEQIKKAQEELANADSWEERQKALQKIEEATAGLSEEQHKALKSLQEFSSFWDEFAASFDSLVVEAFSTSLDVLRQVLELAEPAIRGGAEAVNNLLDSLNRSLKTDEVKAIFEYLGNDAQESIERFGRTAGNILLGFMNIMRAFSPLSNDMSAGLEEMSEDFLNWSRTLQESKGFQEFVNYARENGPKLLSILGGLGEIVIRLGEALAPIGAKMLELLDGFLQFVGGLIENNPTITAFVLIFTQLAGIFMWLVPIVAQLIGGFMSFLAVFAPLFAKVDGSVRILTILRTVFTALMGPIGLVIAVVTGLIAIFVRLWQTNESFRQNVITIWNAIKEVFWTVVTAISTFVMGVFNRLKEFWRENQSTIMDIIGRAWDSIETIITTTLDIIMGVWETFWPIIEETLKVTWNTIETVIDIGLELILGLIETAMNLLNGDWEDAWDSVWDTVQNIWDTITDFIGDIDLKQMGKNIIQGFIDGFTSLNIPMPHFSVSGGFDLNPVGGIGFPDVDVDWYAKGGLFPANSPRLVGLGDATVPEAALPLKPSVLGMIGDKIADTMNPAEVSESKPTPLYLNVRFGDTEFKRHVEDITTLQKKNNGITNMFKGR